MKQCPKCSRSYTDETLNFCLDDGEWLVPADGPATATFTTRMHQAKRTETRESTNAPSPVDRKCIRRGRGRLLKILGIGFGLRLRYRNGTTKTV